MSSLFLEIETSEDVLESFRAIPAALIISFGHSEILTQTPSIKKSFFENTFELSRTLFKTDSCRLMRQNGTYGIALFQMLLSRKAL